MKTAVLLLILICSILIGCKPGDEEIVFDDADRIYISGGEFKVGGKRIWINGANTPWNEWNEFGSTSSWNAYSDTWWNSHFIALRQAGINATRVWINCNNDNNAINIGTDGMVSGASAKHWEDVDKFFQTAARNKIYIMATLLSFDHFENEGSRPTAERWRNMIKSQAASVSFVQNYTIPFVERYKDNPYLWSIDIMNEPDWVNEEAACGNIPWNNISYFLALNAAAIHENSDILVTVGMAYPKWNVDGSGYEGNKISNSFLQNLYSNSKAYLDFWSPHYYDWVGPHYGVPFYVRPNGTRPGGWGLDSSKPSLIGESSAKGSAGNTIITDYEKAFENGWQGVMAWTSNGVDNNGNLSDMSPATLYMLGKYRDLIFPLDDSSE